jgi:hypothetical protein
VNQRVPDELPERLQRILVAVTHGSAQIHYDVATEHPARPVERTFQERRNGAGQCDQVTSPRSWRLFGERHDEPGEELLGVDPEREQPGAGQCAIGMDHTCAGQQDIVVVEAAKPLRVQQPGGCQPQGHECIVQIFPA